MCYNYYISTYIENANAVSITCDIWSKKGLTSLYLGVTAHFYSKTETSSYCNFSSPQAYYFPQCFKCPGFA